MSAMLAETVDWPPDPQLRANRWVPRLVAGITDELDATGRGHRLLVGLLARIDHHPDEDVIDVVRDVDRALASTVDTVALIATAAAVPEIQTLLRGALEQRAIARGRLRRLTEPHPWQPDLRPASTLIRDVLHQANREIVDAGLALAVADGIATAHLAQEEPR